MTNLVPLMGRATDETLTLVTDAIAYFYEEGTLTPLIVYTDETLATPRGTSVAADAEGVFPQCWTSVSQIKVDVKDGDGVSLPGFPQDDFPTIPLGGQTATSVSATPETGNSGTTVQAQLTNNTTRVNRLDNGAAISTSGGSGGAYTLTSTYTITAYAARQEYEFIANHASIGSGNDSLNVDSVGAITIKKYEGSTSKTDLAAGDIAIGEKVRAVYDGTHFVVLSQLAAGEATRGIVEAATTAEMTAGTVNKFPDAAKVKAYVDAQGWTFTSAVAATSGTAVTIASGLPATVSEIVILFNEVGFDGTANLYVQIGDAGGFETTGYSSQSASGGADASETAGFVMRLSNAARALRGTMWLHSFGSNTWVSSHSGGSGALAVSGGGIKALSDTLTQIQIVSSNGTDVFDGSGSVVVGYRT